MNAIMSMSGWIFVRYGYKQIIGFLNGCCRVSRHHLTFIVFSCKFPNGANCPGEGVKNPDIWIVQLPENHLFDLGENDNGSIGGLSEDTAEYKSLVPNQVDGGIHKM